jgi:hypothetical protein
MQRMRDADRDFPYVQAIDLGAFTVEVLAAYSFTTHIAAEERGFSVHPSSLTQAQSSALRVPPITGRSSLRKR